MGEQIGANAETDLNNSVNNSLKRLQTDYIDLLQLHDVSIKEVQNNSHILNTLKILQKNGKIDEAINIYRWFLPLLELDINSKLVQNIKLAETYTGLGSENVRAPRLPLSGDERKSVIAIIENALESRPDLSKYNY